MEYKKMGVAEQLDGISVSMFCDPKAPRQRHPVLSSRVKAALSRHLIPVLARVWSSIMDAELEAHGHVSEILSGLTQFYECLLSTEQTWGLEDR